MIPFINIHTHHSKPGQFAILNTPGINSWEDSEYHSYGIHPWDIGIVNAGAEMVTLEKLCAKKKILAVGEIGLDRAIETSIDTQNEIFVKQVQVADKYDLPVIIHCVKAWSDILSIKKKRNQSTPWILHGFTGNFESADKLIKAGCYISFGSKLLINQSVQKTFKLVQFNRIFLETDDSEVHIEEIYLKAAELYCISLAELKTIIYNNFIKVFGEGCIKNG